MLAAFYVRGPEGSQYCNIIRNSINFFPQRKHLFRAQHQRTGGGYNHPIAVPKNIKFMTFLQVQ